MGDVLITGGAGFIGSHLAEALVDRGYRVIVVDDLSRGSLNNIESIVNDIEFIRGDIADFRIMEEAIRKSDLVIHLASLSRVALCVDDPERCIKTNVMGTEIIARLCSKLNRSLVFSSSREVYGEALYLPVDENHPQNACNLYGASKIAGEKILQAYSRQYGLKYSILRLSNVYGERDSGRVIPIFIEKALRNEDLVVYGEKKVLDFIYIEDVIESFLKLIETVGENNIIVNIGSGKGTKIIDLASTIKEMIGSKSKIVIRGKREEEVEKFIADIKKAETLLNWRPKTPLEEGLKRTISWMTSSPP